jgi:hypothetical protein
MFKRENIMKINLTNNWVAQFIDNIGKSVLSNIETDKYFSLNSEKKMVTQYLVFKIILKNVSLKIKDFNESVPIIINFLLKRSEENENYEFAEIIKDIKLNYDKLVEMNTASIKPNTTTKRTITVTNKSNENKD